MPIRMEQDDPKDQRPQPSGPGGGGNLLKWLPLVLFFVFRKPKLLIPILIVGAVWYFFLGGQQMFSGPLEPEESGVDIPSFSLGASLSEERFDKAQVFEPLAYGVSGMNSLPRRMSLQQYAPTPLHQGGQGSCVGWASAYAARTILESRASGKNPNEVAFSPAYLYNQIHLENCEGAYMLEAMRTMQQNGALPFREFGYDDRTCANYPNRTDIASGQAHRIKGYNRLTVGANNYKPDIMAIKQNLSQGAPVVIGAMVGGTFMSRMLGQKVWEPTSRDYGMGGFGGHAMCVIGYDDDLQGGAFQIMNSWGQEWGDRGFCWIRYDDFEHFVKEAYGVAPMGAAGDQKFASDKMAVKFGLFDMVSESLIPLKQQADILFRTSSPLNIGDKFKVLITNSIECYTYVLGQETNGSSYVLFPYTAKHSPYCGITGTRLFPKDYHMTPDKVGNRDYIAIVVSKEELDVYQLNARMNASKKNTYADKLKDALEQQRIRNTTFVDGETIAFSASLKEEGRNTVGMVIEIDKR
ncbi:MAG: peptidase C1 [Haliscomenobacter sp.]|nr:peptidase C1 [Haliscomenobacter sp.]